VTTRAEVVAALEKYIDEQPIISDDGKELWRWGDGTPVAISIAQAITALHSLRGLEAADLVGHK